jgi:uncharacterized protein YndB with AHSA1/START domain
MTRDRVEREIVVRAPIERAYAALTDPALFPTWGPVAVEGRLAPGERPVLDFGDDGGGKVAVLVVAVDAPSYFAYRWAQGATDPAILLGDPLAAPNTLVEFHLEAVADGTRVRVVESGIAALPGIADHETAAERMGEGWGLMLGGLASAITAGDPTDEVTADVEIAAPRAEVFAALVAPVPWWAQRVDGAIAPGERPLLDFGMFGSARMHVLAVEPPSRLAYEWIEGRPPTRAELTLEETAGGTRIRVRDRGYLALPADQIRRHFRRATQAWTIILGMLRSHLERR